MFKHDSRYRRQGEGCVAERRGGSLRLIARSSAKWTLKKSILPSAGDRRVTVQSLFLALSIDSNCPANRRVSTGLVI